MVMDHVDQALINPMFIISAHIAGRERIINRYSRTLSRSDSPPNMSVVSNIYSGNKNPHVEFPLEQFMHHS